MKNKLLYKKVLLICGRLLTIFFALLSLSITPVFALHNLQKIEKNLVICQENIDSLKEKERTVVNIILQNKTFVQNLPRSIRAFEEVSPLLMLMGSQDYAETIKGLLLLERFYPILQSKMVPILPSLQELVTLRQLIRIWNDKKKKLEESLNKIKTSLREELAKKQQVIRVLCPVPLTTKTKDFDLESYIFEIASFFSQNPISSQKQLNLSLIQPVTGKVLSITPNVLIQTYPKHHVLSPWDGAIVGITFVPSKGYLIVIKQNDSFLILSGLGSITCKEGEWIHREDPLGEMPDHPSELIMQIRQGSHVVDTKPYWRGEKVS